MNKLWLSGFVFLVCCAVATAAAAEESASPAKSESDKAYLLSPERRGRIRSAEFLRAAADETDTGKKARLALEAIRENVDNQAAFAILDGFLHGRELNGTDKLRIGIELIRIAAAHPEKGAFNVAVGYPLVAFCGDKVPEAGRVRANIMRFLLSEKKGSAMLTDRQSGLLDMLGADLIERKEIRAGDEFFSAVLDHNDPQLRQLAAPVAMLFYHAAGKDASDSGLWLFFPSDKRRYQRKFNRALELVESSDATLSANALEGRAALYVRCGLTERADKLIEDAIAKSPADDLTMLYLKLTHLAGTGRIPQAIAFGLAEAKKHPDAVNFPSYLAELYLARKEYDHAIAQARTATRLAPDSPNVRLALVRMLTEKGDYKNALAELNKLASSDSEEIYFKAHLLTLNRRGKEAVAELDKLAQRENFTPDAEFFHQRLAAAGLAGNRELVLRDYEQLRKSGALKNPIVANTVGYTFAVLNMRLPEAKKLVESALAADPENYAYQDSMAWVLYRMKDFNAARQFILLAVRNSEKNASSASAVLLEHAGKILLACGDRAGAREYLEKALAAVDDGEIDQESVRRALERLKTPGKK
ncbi:MAG: hypothetical protein PHS41_03445 [Victivallaceae bacterium]|nr:hypothetical protein [Victivallaceae bacterium]